MSFTAGNKWVFQLSSYNNWRLFWQTHLAKNIKKHAAALGDTNHSLLE